MKKYLLYILLAASVGVSSCDKGLDDNVFDESPDARLNKTLTELQNQLVDAPYGWTATLYTADSVPYTFYFKFDQNNRVTMYSDINATTAFTGKESSYRLKSLQQPSLIFDTYSYIHLLADPDPTANNGTPGEGLHSDFEYFYDPTTAQADTIKLTGRFYGSHLTLVRAPQAIAADIQANGLRGVLFSNISRYLNYFKRITIDGKEYEISVDAQNKTLTLAWLNDNDEYEYFTTSYHFSAGQNGSVIFDEPFVNGNISVNSFDDMQWDEGSSTLSFAVNGANTSVVGLGQPLKVDVEAPLRWWLYSYDEDDYWISRRGFHVNGVDDGFNMRNIANIYSGHYMLYWAGYNAAYDASPGVRLVNGALSIYGPAVAPSLTPDGRMVFNYVGHFGGTLDAVSTGIITNVRTQLTQAAGYYFVQTGATRYDMVSALDGKAWITWEW